MNIIVSCSCGDSDTFDASHPRCKVQIEEWKREHLRQHDKNGDYRDFKFNSCIDEDQE